MFHAVCSHVAKTGDIKDFVITEESGIAKGIRRLVAVTGEEAHEVSRVANAFEARLDRVEKMSGKEKDSGLKSYQFVSAALSSPRCGCLPFTVGTAPSGHLCRAQSKVERSSRRRT
jgi:hypothetical protein